MRLADEPSILYLYELARFHGYFKVGIAKDLRDRTGDAEYGRKVKIWNFARREDCFIVEGGIHSSIHLYKECPEELLGKWTGWTEVFKIDENKVISTCFEMMEPYRITPKFTFILNNWRLGNNLRGRVLEMAKKEIL